MTRILAILMLISLFPHECFAEMRRFGLLIGENQGFRGEAELRFSEKDAERLERVLRELGGYKNEDIYLLKNISAAEARRQLISLNARIRAAKDAGHKTMLFVFYSGHGDSSELHFQSTGLPVAELRELVSGSAADFRILVVDACRSGGLTQVKGATPAPSFDIVLEDSISTHGFAAISSAAASEFAQESDDLEGSIFTVAFVSGLSGAADSSGDGFVTLHEAYSYAFDRTLQTSRSTLVGPQHPTFEFDVRGKGSIVLTNPGIKNSRWGTITIKEPGQYYFLRPDRVVAIEASFSSGRRSIQLPAGHYEVERRSHSYLLSSAIEVTPGGTFLLEEKAMRRIEYAQAVRKGKFDDAIALSLSTSFVARGITADSVPASNGASVALDLHWPRVTISGAVQATYTKRKGDLDGSVIGSSFTMGIAYPIDLAGFTLLGGLEAGPGWLRESFRNTDRLAPPRSNWSGVLAANLGIDKQIIASLGVRVRGAIRAEYFSETRSDNSSESRLHFVPQISLGLAYMILSGGHAN